MRREIPEQNRAVNLPVAPLDSNHGFAASLRPRETRCLPTRIEISDLGYQFLADLSEPSLAPTRELRDQLDRANLSALLNTAEGNGRGQGRQRAKFFVRHSSTRTSTSTIDQGSKAILGKSSQESKILTDCSTKDPEIGMGLNLALVQERPPNSKPRTETVREQ